MLAMATNFATMAATNCKYNYHDVPEKTNNLYGDLCVGNAISSVIFLVVSILTLGGAVAVNIFSS